MLIIKWLESTCLPDSNNNLYQNWNDKESRVMSVEQIEESVSFTVVSLKKMN